MADPRNFFRSPVQTGGQNTGALLAGQKQTEFTRQIVMREALEQNLSPEDGEKFFKFTGRRLFEMGDIEGAFAVADKQREFGAMRAQAEQEQFERALKLEELGIKRGDLQRKINKDERDAAKPQGVDLVKAIDPKTGQPVFLPDTEAVGLKPAPGTPLVQVNPGEQLKEKERAKKEVSLEQATPVLQNYRQALMALNEAMQSGDLQAIADREAVVAALKPTAEFAFARLNQPTGILTDKDVDRLSKGLASPLSVRNLANPGTFQRQLDASFNSVGIPPAASTKAPQEMTDAELDAEIQRLENGG